jgi:gamma-glutamyl hercynylcysteine S-oxide synthase
MASSLAALAAADKSRLVAWLAEARAYTERMLVPIADEDLVRGHGATQSPLAWDVAHIAYFEEFWLVRTVGGEPASDQRFDDLYDAFRHARGERAALDLLGPAEARGYAADVRRRALEVLERVDLASGDRLLRDAFVYRLIVQHELQHAETMFQTIQSAERLVYPLAADDPEPSAPPPAEVLVPADTFVMGCDRDGWAYDNERPAHDVAVAAFVIDGAPVTVGRYLAFMEDGGYRRPELWSVDGWAWRTDETAEAPLYWHRTAGGWRVRRLCDDQPVVGDEPVQHVSWYEADAFARWAGRRLPSEAEWERAATWAGEPPNAAAANLGQRCLGPARVGSFPHGASVFGCHQLVGDVWEWTASEFDGYPGFQAFPYREYSEIFFRDGYRVLRGGSWATHPVVARPTFRNWDLPERRQIFAGFRTARDA